MALNLSGLSAYTDENKMELIKRSILKGRTMEMIQIQADIKSSAMINIIDSTLVAQAGSCGFSSADTTTLTQRELKVSKVKINESICVDDLESFYIQKSMNSGSYNTDLPFEQIYAEIKADKIASLIEDQIWRGDITNGSGNLALVDGLLVAIDAASGVVDGNPTNVTVATGITATNVVGLVDGMVALMPEDIMESDNVKLFVPYAIFTKYTLALRNANLFHQSPIDGDYKVNIYGTNVEMIATKGLKGTNRMILADTNNLYAGVDLMNDSEQFDIFYAKEADEIRFVSKYKLGANIAFPEFIVQFTLVP